MLTEMHMFTYISSVSAVSTMVPTAMLDHEAGCPAATRIPFLDGIPTDSATASRGIATDGSGNASGTMNADCSLTAPGATSTTHVDLSIQTPAGISTGRLD